MKRFISAVLSLSVIAVSGFAQDDVQSSASDAIVPIFTAPDSSEIIASVIERDVDSAAESIINAGKIHSLNQGRECFGSVPVTYQSSIPQISGNLNSIAPFGNTISPYIQTGTPVAYHGPQNVVFQPTAASFPTENVGFTGTSYMPHGRIVQDCCPSPMWGFGRRSRFIGRFR